MAFMKLEQPAYQSSFSVGDAVKVTDGVWKDFVGTINAINEDKGQVTVLLSVFGRETPVDLDFLQVTRL
jgi:transcriptional antiterminator NusG